MNVCDGSTQKLYFCFTSNFRAAREACKIHFLCICNKFQLHFNENKKFFFVKNEINQLVYFGSWYIHKYN